MPREHYPILAGDSQVGEVTSGTFSPTLHKPIAMAYVHAEPCRCRNRTGGRHPRQPRTGPRGEAAVLQTAKKVELLHQSPPH